MTIFQYFQLGNLVSLCMKKRELLVQFRLYPVGGWGENYRNNKNKGFIKFPCIFSFIFDFLIRPDQF